MSQLDMPHWTDVVVLCPPSHCFGVVGASAWWDELEVPRYADEGDEPLAALMCWIQTGAAPKGYRVPSCYRPHAVDTNGLDPTGPVERHDEWPLPTF